MAPCFSVLFYLRDRDNLLQGKKCCPQSVPCSEVPLYTYIHRGKVLAAKFTLADFCTAYSSSCYTVEHSNKGHFGDNNFVSCREVVLISEGPLHCTYIQSKYLFCLSVTHMVSGPPNNSGEILVRGKPVHFYE